MVLLKFSFKNHHYAKPENRSAKKVFILLILFLISSDALAASYLIPSDSRYSVIGELSYVFTNKEDTLLDIARRFDFGYEELIQVNPNVDRWVPGEGRKILLPGQFILPDAPKDGIVLNLAELRLYYFPKEEPGLARRVYTYPISIGRMDWKSPLGKTRIIAKEKEPAWYPPESIRAEHAAEGEYLQKVIPGGDPSNPLGHYALSLALPHYLIHGTDERKEYGIGMRVTHGCIRMYPEDIEQLFSLVEINTPVTFIDQPIKLGWQGAELFLEIQSPLAEEESDFEEYSHRVNNEDIGILLTKIASGPLSFIPGKIGETMRLGNGIPTVIAQTVSRLPPANK